MFRTLSILLVTTILVTPIHAQTRPENPDIPGEAGLRAYRAQKARERQGLAANASLDTTPRPSSIQTQSADITPSVSARRSSAEAAASTASTAPSTSAEEAAKPTTPLQLAQMRREEKANRAARERSEKLLHFIWSKRHQAPLHWNSVEKEIDGIGQVYSVLKTPRNTLTGTALAGYKTTDKNGFSNTPGLILGNSVRNDLCLEFYTFPPAAFLPHLKTNAVRAYQAALPAQFDQYTVEVVGAEEARNTYGPALADLLTRRIRFRLIPEEGSKSARNGPIEVADYLIPLPGEWLVVRFSASEDLFPAACEAVDSFLNRLELVEPAVATAWR